MDAQPADDWITPGAAPAASPSAVGQPADDWITPAAAPAKDSNSLDSNLQAEREKTADRTVEDLSNPNYGPVSRALNTVGTGFEMGISDPVKAGLKTGYKMLPDSVQSGISDAASSSVNALKSASQAIGKPAPYGTAKAGLPDQTADLDNAVAKFRHENPVFDEAGRLAGDVASVSPAVGGAAALAEAAPGALKTGLEGASSLAKSAADTSPGKGLTGMLKDTGSGSPTPTPIRSVADVTKANKGLADNTNGLYKKADDLGFSFTPEGGQWLSSTVRGNVEDAVGGLDKQNHPGVIAALKTLDDKAQDGLTLSGFDKVRQTLGRLASNTNPDKANEVFAANKARRAMDEALGEAQYNPTLATGHPDAVEALNAARAAHSIEMQHSDLRTIVRNANGNGNEIQSEFKKMFEDEDGFDNLIPQNQKIVQSVAQPGMTMNAAKGVGKLGLGAGGDKWALSTEGLAAALHPSAAPIIGPAVAAGTVSNLVRNRLLRQAADQAMKNLEAASEPAYPLYGKSKFSLLDDGQKALPAPTKPLALPAPSGGPDFIAGRQPYPEYPAQNTGAPRATTQAEREASIAASQNPDSYAAGHEPGSPQIYNPPELNRSPSKVAAFKMENPKMDMASRWEAEKAGIDTTDMTDEEVRHILKNKSAFGFARGGAVNTKPTPGQKMAGNYKKMHVKFQGLDISIENPKGSSRSGVGKDGKEWKSVMPAHYGYIKRTEGADGDHVDCYIGANEKSNRVYVIDQKNHDSGEFDEHKVMLGYGSRDEALRAYRNAFSDRKNRVMSITRMSVEEFKKWLKSGNTKSPVR